MNLANGIVYAGGGGNLTALNATTGAKIWNYTTGILAFLFPAIANGVVYVGSFLDGSVYAIGNQS